MKHPISRRTALRQLGAGAALTTSMSLSNTTAAEAKPRERIGRVKQSVCQWCYNKMPLDALGAAAAGMGLKSVELLQPKDFPTLRKHGLICAMVSNPTVRVGERNIGSIPHAWNRLEHHNVLVAAYEGHLKATAEAGYPNLICFSGNRDGLSDAQGLENCATGLKRIVPLAEKLGITVCMELLNSRVNHKDYMCDRTEWGVELCQRIGSDRFKLLYDIYHMQIMEGDVIRTLTDHKQHIAHFHTGGVPGRAEIDASQELNYGAICRAIVANGFEGYLGQEFIPRREPMASLAEAAAICDV
jgi:hydroxypyruvate isomerase